MRLSFHRRTVEDGSSLPLLSESLPRRSPLRYRIEPPHTESRSDIPNPPLTYRIETKDYGGNSRDSSGYSSTEELIRRDQAELGHSEFPEPHQYPPQPEVEFGFPQICYCGAQPILATNRSDPAEDITHCSFFLWQ
ncbi:hypothetical protein Bca52824_055808 [Brassica carinata]|uniref:Uncharacterized protein n=1 Tax=Brassica carinata TaxID=52824 RepID=A0A8X7R8B4_BRACI|nr:hypothetical protein Bca52824_055808 [Brassica carinata]